MVGNATTSSSSSSSGGLGFIGLLTIVFITLKLLGYITWSWLWVLAPLWLPVVVVGGLFIIGFGVWLAYQMIFGGSKWR